MHRVRKLSVLNATAIALLFVAVVGVIGASVGVRAGSYTGGKQSVAEFPLVAELGAATNLVIAGTGYEPGQKLRFLLGDVMGNQSDITLNLVATTFVEAEDAIATDSSGNFAASFNMGRFERVMYESSWGIAVVDLEYNTLATTPLIFCDPNGNSQAGEYPRGAPAYAETPDDPRPAPFCSGIFEYPERPGS